MSTEDTKTQDAISERSRSATEPAPAKRPGDAYGIGERIGGIYEVVGLIGEGGMGQVFEALDTTLDRRVAIKVARAESQARQLRNEARALAAFRHPSLVTVYSLGVDGTRDFLVMERITGINVAEHVMRRAGIGQPLGLVEAVEMLVSVADGLSIVHRAGLAHRDVKLENMMLTPDGRVVLMDFGLAVPEFHFGGGTSVAGSPPYMAPETLNRSGESGNGHLVDVYALGVCAFEMLTGKKPILAPSLAELIALHASGFVPPVTEFRADVPDRLVSLILSMMAKTPTGRPATMEAVAWQLRSIRDRELVKMRIIERSIPADTFDVLIVDDDADITRILEFYVRKALGRVTLRVARDGIEAMQRLQDREPDFMLLDLHMPRMNGIDVCMQMRGLRIAPSTTIVSVSAGAQHHDRELMHQLGIHHFVEKGGRLRDDLTRVLREAAGVSV